MHRPLAPHPRPRPQPHPLCAAATALLLVSASAPALASFETRLGGGSYASYSSNIADQNMVDNRLYELNAERAPGRQAAVSVARASGDYDYRYVDGSSVQRSGGESFAQSVASADNGLARASANAQFGGAIIVQSVVPGGGEMTYDAELFNKTASAYAAADVYTRTGVQGAAGAKGVAIFNGFVEGTVLGNGVVHGFDPYDPRNHRDGLVGASFLFNAAAGAVGADCFSFDSNCGATGVSFKFGAEVSATENGGYLRPFKVTADIEAGQELQTWMSLQAYAQTAGIAEFGNTARITGIEVLGDLALDTRDGLLLRNGNQYTLVGTAPLPVPEPATWALMLLGIGATGLAARRRSAGSRSSPLPA